MYLRERKVASMAYPSSRQFFLINLMKDVRNDSQNHENVQCTNFKDTNFRTAILSEPRHFPGKGSTFISQNFQDPECWSGPGNRTLDLL